MVPLCEGITELWPFLTGHLANDSFLIMPKIAVIRMRASLQDKTYSTVEFYKGSDFEMFLTFLLIHFFWIATYLPALGILIFSNDLVNNDLI